MNITNPKQLINFLEQIDACRSSIQWVSQNTNKTLYDLYRTCPRGDWLLWFAVHIGIDLRLVVLAACDCAEQALKFVPDSDDRPRNAIATTRKWCAGAATIKEVLAAAAAADAAADAARYAAAAAAVHAAKAAFYAAEAAVYADDAAAAAYAAAAYAADDAAAAAYAAAAYAADAAAVAAEAAAHAAEAAAEPRTASFALCAKLVRKRIPFKLFNEPMNQTQKEKETQ